MFSRLRPFLLAGLAAVSILTDSGHAIGLSAAAAALNGLMASYNSTSGLWDLNDDNAAWWQSAVALQATLDFIMATGSQSYVSLANYTINTQRAPLKWWPQGGGDFRADSTDDTGWWALALLSMYSITGEQWLLDIAVEDETYMSNYWTTECGGGVIWQIRDLSYKAAISNELYLELTATLHNLIPGDEAFLGKSLLTWAWLRDSGMINSASLVNDGLMRSSNGDCVNNNAPTWTYNQGVILGGLVQLHIATGDLEFIETARKIADAVIASPHLAPAGILTEPCPAEGCVDANPASFKGIFIRYLAKLNAQIPGRPYSAFISDNAKVMFSRDRSSNGPNFDLYDLRWQGPFRKSSLGSQESAVMLLTAALGT